MKEVIWELWGENGDVRLCNLERGVAGTEWRSLFIMVVCPVYVLLYLFIRASDQEDGMITLFSDRE
jgi:hypothetical protein